MRSEREREEEKESKVIKERRGGMKVGSRVRKLEKYIGAIGSVCQVTFNIPR